jgi:hypothetical protein
MHTPPVGPITYAVTVACHPGTPNNDFRVTHPCGLTVNDQGPAVQAQAAALVALTVGYPIPRPQPTDPCTAPSAAGTAVATANAVDSLDWRVAVLEGRPNIPGPPGPPGPAGPAQALGWVATVDELPTAGTPGDAYLVGPTLVVHVWADPDGWAAVASLIGPAGPIGPDGPTGPTGNANATVAETDPVGVPADGALWYRVTRELGRARRRRPRRPVGQRGPDGSATPASGSRSVGPGRGANGPGGGTAVRIGNVDGAGRRGARRRGHRTRHAPRGNWRCVRGPCRVHGRRRGRRAGGTPERERPFRDRGPAQRGNGRGRSRPDRTTADRGRCSYRPRTWGPGLGSPRRRWSGPA